MEIDISNFKIVYEDRVYNCVSMIPLLIENKIDYLEVFYINEDNRLAFLKDSVDKFQFINK